MDTQKHAYEDAHPIGHERREHRRYRSDFLRLTFLGVEHMAVNWSESGALIPNRHPALEVGATVDGVAVIGPGSHRFRFSAEIVRCEPQHIAIRFVNLSTALRRALSTISS